jgi:hypothetical protein
MASKTHSGAFWKNSLGVGTDPCVGQPVASYTVHSDGMIEFQGRRYRVFIENIGTAFEKVIVNDISDLNDE